MTPRRLFFGGSAPAGPKGCRAYVIGDVHGCLSLLDRLLERIEEDIAEEPKRKISLIFLGDLIDRGPASAQVVERVRTYSHPGVTTHFVMGNHEEVMLRVIAGDTDILSNWLRFGGSETLRSYGVAPVEVETLSRKALVEKLARTISRDHREFLAGFADSVSFGDYVLVHAGIRPGVDLSEQSQSDLRWIREPFLEDSTDHGFTVVHGHTISTAVDVAANRIGIDTGAYCSGVLTALAIDGRKRWLIQTSDKGTDRVRLD